MAARVRRVEATARPYSVKWSRARAVAASSRGRAQPLACAAPSRRRARARAAGSRRRLMKCEVFAGRHGPRRSRRSMNTGAVGLRCRRRNRCRRGRSRRARRGGDPAQRRGRVVARALAVRRVEWVAATSTCLMSVSISSWCCSSWLRPSSTSAEPSVVASPSRARAARRRRARGSEPPRRWTAAEQPACVRGWRGPTAS